MGNVDLGEVVLAVIVGGTLGVVTDKVLHDETTTQEHRNKLMAATAAVYLLGLAVGAMRPEGGYTQKLLGKGD